MGYIQLNNLMYPSGFLQKVATASDVVLNSSDI